MHINLILIIIIVFQFQLSPNTLILSPMAPGDEYYCHESTEVKQSDQGHDILLKAFKI